MYRREGFVCFAVAHLTMQWAVLMDGQGQALPVATRYDGRGLAISWLPYEGPGKLPDAQIGSRLSDADLEAALKKLSATRYEGLKAAAWGIGCWSTCRQPDERGHV